MPKNIEKHHQNPSEAVNEIDCPYRLYYNGMRRGSVSREITVGDLPRHGLKESNLICAY
jgi:hypothetical protein